MTEMVMTNTGRELHHQQLLIVLEGMATEDLNAGLLSGEAAEVWGQLALEPPALRL